MKGEIDITILKGIKMDELQEKEWILGILEKAVENSDSGCDTLYYKALLNRIDQIINNLKESRHFHEGEAMKNMAGLSDKLIEYYQHFIEARAEGRSPDEKSGQAGS